MYSSDPGFGQMPSRGVSAKYLKYLKISQRKGKPMQDKNGNRFMTEEDLEKYFLTVSHELKAPLTEIYAYVKIIEEDCRDLLPEQSMADLQSIRKICEQAMGTIRTYIGYSKIQSSEIVLEKLSLGDLIRDQFRELTAPLRDRKISLQLPDRVPDVIADRFLFSQLISNIFSNSIKFTSAREEALISLRVSRDSEMTHFFFRDNGEGVNEEFARRAFDLFEKTDSDNNRTGTGIGLNLVHRIVERFHGNVSISSTEGEDFSIQISLPNQMVIMPVEKTEPGEEEIRIGVIGAVTGVYSEIAPCRRYAYELAVEEINAAGGILGKKVRLLFRDFSSDLAEVPAIAWQLTAADNVDVLMGGQLSSAREYIRDVAHKMQIPYFFNALYEGGIADHYTFCVSNTPEQNVYPMLDQLLSVYGSRCYIIAADYNYGILSAECSRNYIEKKGGSIVGIEYFTPTKKDFTDSIEKIREANPDILLSFCVGNNQICFHEQWYRTGKKKIPVISTIGVGLSSLHRRLPAPYMQNTYFMSSYIEELDTREAEAFTKRIRDRFADKNIPYIEFDAETAYTAVYLYKKAVEEAGTTDTEAVIAALESGRIDFSGPGGRVIVRGEDHHVVRDVILFRVNKQNEVEKLMYFPALQTHFVEEALKQEFGRKTTLRELGRQAPDIQYNVMYNRIV